MKNYNKILAFSTVLYIFASLLFIGALICFCTKNNPIGFVLLPLGSVCLCLGSHFGRRPENNGKKNAEGKNEDKQ